MNKLIIIGASGHGKVVADIAALNGYKDIVFLDNDSGIKTCVGHPVLGPDTMTSELDGDVFVAVGNAEIRKKLMERDANRNFPVLIHPSAVIAESAEVGTGSVVMAGAVINHVRFGHDLLESIYATYIVISCAEATSNDANLDGIKFGPYYEGKTYQEVMSQARTKGFSELIKRRFVIGSFALMRENQDVLFLRAQKNRAKIVERTNQILADNDFIFVPAAPTVAPKLGATSDKLSDEYLIADNHLALGNFAGLPSITMPLGYEGGLPFGANFMGRAFEESKLLSICRTFEKITGICGDYYGKEGK